MSAAGLVLPSLVRSDLRSQPAVEPGPEAFELDEVTISGVQAGMKSGKFTARSLTEKYFSQIASIDKQGPALNSVIEVNPDALSIADALDAERRAKGPRGPLHGVCVLIKDNIGTADRMMTTAGSLALLGFTPTKDSAVARRLREAGAVIIGKTNLSEWANFRSSHSSSGWSGRGGQTRNPYALDRNPCGSSSGSAAAASANLCSVAVGTETDGSIVCPSSATCLVGIKPTVGLLSRSGIIPISHNQDTPGPMCRTVTDAAILLGALTGVDPDDSSTSASRGKGFTDYTQFLDRNGLRRARIGVVQNLFPSPEVLVPIMDEALHAMKLEGAVVVNPIEIETLGKFDDSEREAMLYEFKADLDAYLASFAPNIPVCSLKEIIDFNERNREKEMPFFGQDLLIKAETKGTLNDRTYQAALGKNRRLSRQEGIDAVMDKHHLDALVAPTAGPSWLTDLLDGDHDTGHSATPAAVAGYPNINVPAGFIFGMPVGISFFGRAWSESTLIKIAYAFEQATLIRRAPQFRPSVEFPPRS